MKTKPEVSREKANKKKAGNGCGEQQSCEWHLISSTGKAEKFFVEHGHHRVLVDVRYSDPIMARVRIHLVGLESKIHFDLMHDLEHLVIRRHGRTRVALVSLRRTSTLSK